MDARGGTEYHRRMRESDRPGSLPGDGDELEWLARMDSSYAGALSELARLVWAPAAPALALKYRHIIASVILGCRSDPAIEVHLRGALAAGASVRELLEGFETAAILGGFPVLHFALPCLRRLHEESRQGTDERAAADNESAARDDDERGAAATAAISRGMSEWAWLDAVDPAYDAARRHITSFVWTPRNPALPVRIRELVASAVLAYRAFPTLDGHLRRAVREGASLRELLEAMQTAALPGGFPVLHYALRFLSEIQAAIEKGALP